MGLFFTRDGFSDSGSLRYAAVSLSPASSASFATLPRVSCMSRIGTNDISAQYNINNPAQTPISARGLKKQNNKPPKKYASAIRFNTPINRMFGQIGRAHV